MKKLIITSCAITFLFSCPDAFCMLNSSTNSADTLNGEKTKETKILYSQYGNAQSPNQLNASQLVTIRPKNQLTATAVNNREEFIARYVPAELPEKKKINRLPLIPFPPNVITTKSPIICVQKPEQEVTNLPDRLQKEKIEQECLYTCVPVPTSTQSVMKMIGYQGMRVMEIGRELKKSQAEVEQLQKEKEDLEKQKAIFQKENEELRREIERLKQLEKQNIGLDKAQVATAEQLKAVEKKNTELCAEFENLKKQFSTLQQTTKNLGLQQPSTGVLLCSTVPTQQSLSSSTTPFFASNSNPLLSASHPMPVSATNQSINRPTNVHGIATGMNQNIMQTNIPQALPQQQSTHIGQSCNYSTNMPFQSQINVDQQQPKFGTPYLSSMQPNLMTSNIQTLAMQDNEYFDSSEGNIVTHVSSQESSILSEPIQDIVPNVVTTQSVLSGSEQQAFPAYTTPSTMSATFMPISSQNVSASIMHQPYSSNLTQQSFDPNQTLGMQNASLPMMMQQMNMGNPAELPPQSFTSQPEYVDFPTLDQTQFYDLSNNMNGN